MDKWPLEAVLPHRPPMILLSDYEPDSFTDEGVCASVTVTENDLFYDAAREGVPASVAIEYMAQTVACYVGLMQRRQARPPRIGFVLGSRKIEWTIPLFKRGEWYRIRARLLFTDDAFASFETVITDGDGETVASGIVNAFQPEDAKVFLEAENGGKEER
ncbi:MAG: 3-hydroxylacyl-ACP dehydratase [Kiritimatiellae bacterium]|nr:3-hydroxylacyl-ACP dehydratase [Kiritimatiellia bacterium]